MWRLLYKTIEGMDKVPITLDTVRVTENLYRMYNEHLKEEQVKKRQKEMEKTKVWSPEKETGGNQGRREKSTWDT